MRLRRQVEAEVTSLCVDCSLRNLAESGRRQIIESSTRLVEFFFGGVEQDSYLQNTHSKFVFVCIANEETEAERFKLIFPESHT